MKKTFKQRRKQQIFIAIVMSSCFGTYQNAVFAQQMAPSGYTSAINTPNARVLPFGSMKLSYHNSIPERASVFPGEPFGGVTAGFGALPGLELVGRLAFDGDLNCNVFLATCNGRTRDLSVSAKYQLPLHLPLNTKIAAGFTDFGGAATNFRSAYGVASTALGPFDLSLGYGKKASPNALLGGAFGSVVLNVTDHLQLIAESDTQAKRIGAALTQPITEQLELQLGLSRKLSGSASQKANQITASMQYVFDKSMLAKHGRYLHSSTKTGAAHIAARSTDNDKLTLEAQAQAMSNALKKNGFAQISIRHTPPSDKQLAHWQLVVEPLFQRTSHELAIGKALGIWLSHIGSADASLTLELTYMAQTYRQVSTTRQCLLQFSNGHHLCGSNPTLAFDQSDSDQVPKAYRSLVSAERELDLKPQFELGLDLITAVGTEVGLVDYSLALDAGVQLQLSQGLFFQGNVLAPFLKSDDFRKNGLLTAFGHNEIHVDQSLLSYAQPFKFNGQKIETQLSVGAIDRQNRGAQADALWRDASGHWTFGGSLGAYRRLGQINTPALLTAKRSIIPGRWSLEATAGKFLRGDRGWFVRSEHWFGDVNLSFKLHSSSGGSLGPAKRSFAGIELSLPFTSWGQRDVGWASVRAADRVEWGLRTKVGDTDNALTSGYAQIPKPRHGIYSEVSNFGRAATSDTLARHDFIREGMFSPD